MTTTDESPAVNGTSSMSWPGTSVSGTLGHLQNLNLISKINVQQCYVHVLCANVLCANVLCACASGPSLEIGTPGGLELSDRGMRCKIEEARKTATKCTWQFSKG